jgi:transcriptional regulator PpsR
VAAAADIALIVDLEGKGVVRDLAVGDEGLPLENRERWIGKSWAETVTAESRPKIEALLREAAAGGEPQKRHVIHRSERGADLPVAYYAIPLRRGRRAVAVGRSLHNVAALQQQLVEAQQSMERDFWRFRQAETRYRLLFQMSSEAVLIVNASSYKIVEANPAVAHLPAGDGFAPGRVLPECFDAGSAEALKEVLARVRATARTEQLRVQPAGQRSEMLVAISLYRQEGDAFFLVRIASPRIDAAAATVSDARSRLLEAAARAPDGLVITDQAGRILMANPAFLDFVQLATEEQVRGESLERWLGRGRADLGVLLSGLREHGVIRLFSTVLRGDYGAVTDVEISAAAFGEGTQAGCGFSIRSVERRLRGERAAAKKLPRSVEQLTELVGKVPLRELVRESTDLIERLCIEAALELTGNNRASAAEMLGLSRQSLYVKLRRYGLSDSASEATA